MVLEYVVESILVPFSWIVLVLYFPLSTLSLMIVSLSWWILSLLIEEENIVLCLIPKEMEIFSAINDLGLDKAPGSDGMSRRFYKFYWPIVKSSVISSIQSFFRGGFMLWELIHTNIVLIQKFDNPSMVHQFRPISLTNLNYKIISKILSNRFKPLLHKIVSPF